LLIVGHDVVSHLFRNNGDGSFARVTTGLLATDQNGANQGTWVDYDNDGDLDLFVDSAFPLTHRLYRNEGNGVFTVVADQLGGPLDTTVSRYGTSFAGCWADYDNNGFPDVFIANAAKNFLYRNNGDGTFTNIADSAVVQDTI